MVYGVLIDDKGNIWGSTNKGIFKFTPPDEESGSGSSSQLTVSNTGTFRNYDVSDGLQSNEFNQGSYHKGKSGLLYFGGINGFNIFHPDSVKDNPFSPKMVITNFKIFNEDVTVWNEKMIKMPGNELIKVRNKFYLQKHIIYTDTIIISYKENAFTIEYTGLHYMNPDKNQYAYMLEPFDKHWNYVETRRYATYTNLKPGTYLFKLKGCNADGVWNKQPAIYTFIVTPPYWETGWFYSAQLLFFMLLIGGTLLVSRRSKKSRLITILVYICLFVIFEFVQNLCEPFYENFVGSAPIIKTLLNLILASTLLPVQLLLKNFLGGTSVKTGRKGMEDLV